MFQSSLPFWAVPERRVSLRSGETAPESTAVSVERHAAAKKEDPQHEPYLSCIYIFYKHICICDY